VGRAAGGDRLHEGARVEVRVDVDDHQPSASSAVRFESIVNAML
jgi:hypothetical protein